MNAPFRIAKTHKKMGNMGTLATTDGFTSYVITTGDGYSYTLTFQEVNGYTTIVVTNPGGVSPNAGNCIDKIVAILEKWINAAYTINNDNGCSVARSFVNDFRTLKDCVPTEAKPDFENAIDQLDKAVDQYCQ